MRSSLAVLAAVWALSGCKEDPEPKKLERVSPFERGVNKQRKSAPDDPLRNPAYETPMGRDGEQIPEPEIDAALAEAAGHAETGNVTLQRGALRKCANKTPVSARCDGEMGLTMIEAKNRRATALYYLESAAGIDDPKADAALYLEIGDALRRHGRREQAIAALELSLAREPTAETTFLLGQVLSLSSEPAQLIMAADRMARASAMDERIEWLHDEAVIRGQIPIREQAEAAVALFREYVERAATLPPDELPTPPEALTVRVAELELMAEQYPSQAEFEAQSPAEAGDAATPKPGPAPVDPTERASGPS